MSIIPLGDGNFEDSNGGPWEGPRRLVRVPGRGFGKSVGYLTTTEELFQGIGNLQPNILHSLEFKTSNPRNENCEVVVSLANSTTGQPAGERTEENGWLRVTMQFLPVATSSVISFASSDKGCVIDDVVLQNLGIDTPAPLPSGDAQIVVMRPESTTTDVNNSANTTGIVFGVLVGVLAVVLLIAWLIIRRRRVIKGNLPLDRHQLWINRAAHFCHLPPYIEDSLKLPAETMSETPKTTADPLAILINEKGSDKSMKSAEIASETPSEEHDPAIRQDIGGPPTEQLPVIRVVSGSSEAVSRNSPAISRNSQASYQMPYSAGTPSGRPISFAQPTTPVSRSLSPNQSSPFRNSIYLRDGYSSSDSSRQSFTPLAVVRAPSTEPSDNERSHKVSSQYSVNYM